MKKLFSTVLLLVLSIAMVFANGASETTTAAPEAQGKTEVRIWTMDRHDASFWQERIDKYNATNPHNIYVNYEVFTDNYWQAVDMAFQTGEAPDVLRYDPALDKHLFSDKFIDLLPLLSEDQKDLTREGWYEGVNYIDGKLYCIFTGNGVCRLFYNQTIFDRLGLEPPKSLDELVECATTITNELSGEGIYGFAANLKSSANGLKRSLEPSVELGEGVRFGYDFGKGVYDFTPYIPYLQAWKDLMKVAFPGCESLDIDPLRSQFAAGKIGMYMSYAQAEPGVYDNQFPMAEGQSYGCVYLPVENGERDYKLGAGGTPAYYINKNSDKIDEAWIAYSELFLDFDNLVARYEANLGLSNLSQVQAVAKLSPKFVEYPELLINPELDTVYPKTPEEKYPQDFVVEGMDMYSTFGAIIGNQLDLEKGIADLTKRYNKANEEMIKTGIERIINPAFAR